MVSSFYLALDKWFRGIEFSGWAYDLKSVSTDVVQKRMARSGDGDVSYSNVDAETLKRLNIDRDAAAHDHQHENLIWGWDDADFKDDDKSCATILHKSNN